MHEGETKTQAVGFRAANEMVSILLGWTGFGLRGGMRM